MIDSESRHQEGIEDEQGEDVDLLSQLADLNIAKDDPDAGDSSLRKRVLSLDNPVFEDTNRSSKIQTVMTELGKLRDKHVEDGVMEKAVVVSQWTSMLEIVKQHVKTLGMKCTAITGTVFTISDLLCNGPLNRTNPPNWSVNPM